MVDWNNLVAVKQVDGDYDPEELALMEEAYGDERYRTLCTCGEDLEAIPAPSCEVPWVHGEDVYK